MRAAATVLVGALVTFGLLMVGDERTAPLLMVAIVVCLAGVVCLAVVVVR